MFRHQKPMTADFLGLEKVVATNRFRQTGKNMMMLRLMQELIEDEANNRVSTYGHTGLRRMAGLPASYFVVDSMYGYAALESRKHYDHGYVSKRVGQKEPERVYDEAFNPIMQAVMGMIDHIEVRLTGDWRKDWYLQAFREHPLIRRRSVGYRLTDAHSGMGVLCDIGTGRFKPRPYQKPLLDILDIHYPVSKLH